MQCLKNLLPQRKNQLRTRRIFKEKNKEYTRKKLHWLPIQHPILFKYNLLVFKAINLSQHPYLSALIRSSSLTRGNRLSVSSTRPKKHIGRRGFAVAAPAVWNKLPQTVRSQQTIDCFRSQLKTYLFRLAYPPP